MKGINGHEADWDCDFISTGSGVLIRGNVWGFPQEGFISEEPPMTTSCCFMSLMATTFMIKTSQLPAAHHV